MERFFVSVFPTVFLFSQDSFSISNIGVFNMAASYDCSGPAKITYYPSVTNLTNYMAEYSIGLLTKNLNYRR